MTPAVNLLQKKKIPHQLFEYQHDKSNQDFGKEAADKLGLAPEAVFKTLLACDANDKHKMVVAIVPVAGMLDLKALAKAAKLKKMVMAQPVDAERTTGYIVGGISPIGQKKRLPTFIDSSAQDFEQIYVSGGKRGLDIGLTYQALVQATGAVLAEIKG
ncbi:Cys-tRNA(Pro) deacylase [Motilimonas sp. KMU-193]|uniref:Cys-tRNA(Pro) deacylase n=1 Tax=Motilimonas sp. KMU-193 TaxID=3388668 RepID=UPI00396AF530